MHLLSITEVYPAKLKSEEKRQALTLQRVDEYNQCIQDSHILLPHGPFSLIDMHQLTKGSLFVGTILLTYIGHDIKARKRVELM